MNREELIQQIKDKNSYLCVGLDTDINKIPKHLLSYDDPIYEFNKAIIDATAKYCVSYKLNTAFYEQFGVKGWESMAKTLEYIPKGMFTIADAKRGDIGNTSTMYAKAFFETMDFDAVTVAPYMGEDSVKPFLEFKDKWTIVLGLTSNAGSKDFQVLNVDEEEKLYERVLATVSKWGSPENLMFVVGATKADMLANIRRIIPNHFLLVPGVGAQGGSLEEVSKFGMNVDTGLLINSSRAIIYASNGEDFAERAGQEAAIVQGQMKQLLSLV